MNDFEAALTQAAAEVQTFHLGAMLPRMLMAALIGASLAYRPWRLLLGQPIPKSEMIQAQILLCAAAAVITAVIGNSVAKAFGLVGLGGFVRFRSGLKDPRDAAILFLLIGLGMACGHGSLGLAAVGTVFVAVLLFVLDAFGSRSAPVEAHPVLLSAETEDPAATEAAIRKVIGARNVLVTRSALDFPGKKLELQLEGIRPEHLTALLAKPLGATRWSVSAHRTEEKKKAKEERA